MHDLREKIKRQLIVLGLMLLSVITIFSGCGNKAKNASGSTGKASNKSFFIGLTNAPAGFNPLFSPDTVGKFITRLFYDTLLGQPEANKFTPHLASSFETKDKQTYIIKLNPKAKWTDGKPITADDVVFTLNIIANPKVETSRGSYISMLKGVDNVGKLVSGVTIPDLKALDATTVELKCKQPVDPNYIKGLLGFQINIIPKHVFEKLEPGKISSSEAATKPTVTSGAYKFVKYISNDHIELVSNEEYFLGVPKLKKIFMRIMNGTNLVVELKAGKIHMAAGGGIGVVPVKDIEILKKEKNITVDAFPSLQAQVLYANNGNSSFNAKFRRAITMAIDRQKIVKDLFKGYAEVVPTLYTKASPVYDATVQPLAYDPEMAKKELTASGFDTAKELILQVPIGNVIREHSADLIQQNLQAIGLKVKIQKMDFPTLLGNARKGDYDLLLIGLDPSLDPDNSSYFVKGGSNNMEHTDDIVLDELCTKGVTVASFAERKTVYGEIQKRIRDNQYMTTLYSPLFFKVQSKNLVGGVKPFWEGSLDDIHTWYLK